MKKLRKLQYSGRNSCKPRQLKVFQTPRKCLILLLSSARSSYTLKSKRRIYRRPSHHQFKSSTPVHWPIRSVKNYRRSLKRRKLQISCPINDNLIQIKENLRSVKPIDLTHAYQSHSSSMVYVKTQKELLTRKRHSADKFSSAKNLAFQ